MVEWGEPWGLDDNTSLRLHKRNRRRVTCVLESSSAAVNWLENSLTAVSWLESSLAAVNCLESSLAAVNCLESSSAAVTVSQLLHIRVCGWKAALLL